MSLFIANWIFVLVVALLAWTKLGAAILTGGNRLISLLFDLVLSRIYRYQNTFGSTLPSAPYIFPNGQGNIEKFLHGKQNSEIWEKTHGPIYRIWAGMTPEIVLTKPEHIQQVFKDSDTHLKAVDNNSGYIFSQILGKCVGLVSQEEWKTVRAVSEHAFVRSASTSHLDIIIQRTKRHLSELQEKASWKQGYLDPAQDLKMLPFWVVAEIIYGPLSVDMETQLVSIAPERESLFRHVIQGGLSRYAWMRTFLFRGAAHQELARFREKWAHFNDVAYRRAVDEKLSVPIVSMTEAASSGRITMEHLRHTLDEVLFANLDVTLGGISWNVVFLAAFPDCQHRLREEIVEWRQRAVAGNISKENALNEYFSSSTTYLAACISESARLRPLAAFSVPQATPSARVVGGYYFPAGTNFIVDSYALNQRNPFWDQQTTKQFRPERFLSLSATKARYHYWRFGFGPRQCMGKYVADLILRILLVEIVENNILALDEEEQEKWRRDPDTWINHPQMFVRCQPIQLVSSARDEKATDN